LDTSTVQRGYGAGHEDLSISLLAAVLLAVALPTSANTARTKSCEGIGGTITKLRSKGRSCDAARTLAARWVETAAAGGGPSSGSMASGACAAIHLAK
jgi:hypothetical protein